MSGPVPDPPIVRMLRRRQVTPDGCWVWPGAHTPDGYGKLTLSLGRQEYTHRISYRTFKGPIPEGLELDHLCRNTACFNPAHLEAVTHGENVRRGRGGTTPRRLRTHCSEGHAFDEKNTYVDKRGWRYCRICGARRSRKHYLKRKREPMSAVGVA